MLRRIALLLLLVGLYSGAVFTTNGCAGGRVQLNVILTGRVTNERTGNPVRGAEVSLQGRSDVTDENGAYELRSLYPGTDTLVVSHDSYLPTELRVNLTEGTNRRDVALVPR